MAEASEVQVTNESDMPALPRNNSVKGVPVTASLVTGPSACRSSSQHSLVVRGPCSIAKRMVLYDANADLPRRQTPRGALEQHALSGGPFDAASYEALKQRVVQLKKEQQNVVKSRAAAHELESSALLQQRQQHEAAEAALQAEVASLKEQLRNTTERAAKVRMQLEKEKRALQVQLEGFEKVLETREAEHDKHVAHLQSHHEQELAHAMQQVEELQQGRDDDRLAFQKARDAAVTEVSDWCEGEVEAVRHLMGERLEASQQEQRQWQVRCEQLEQQAVQGQAALAESCQLSDQLREQLTLLSQQLEEQRQLGLRCDRELERERQGRLADRERAAQDLAAQAATLKALHRDQLALVGQRLEQVVGRKDSTIAALKAELQRVTDKLHKFEELLLLAGDSR